MTKDRRECIVKLTEKQIEILVQKTFRVKNRVIANELGVSEPRINQIMKQIRKRLEKRVSL